MILTTTFMLNLLCAMVPCDPRFQEPEILQPAGNNNALGPVLTDERDQLANRIDKRFLESGRQKDDKSDPFVVTKHGAIEGFRMLSSGGNSFFAFQGIPYAEPPVGNLRFRAPVPRKPWQKVLRATQPGPDCLQQSPSKMFRVVGTEDCLFLNIYTQQLPGKNRRPKLPVIVWIHGGAFSYGSGAEYGPSYLMDEKIVLVTFNYRLGILGFISTGDGAAPGNAGLKDQALAMQWVHENIDNFGGDPEKVTILGHSAGGSAAHLHMISPRTRPYFQRAISMSGTAFNRFGFKMPEQVTKYTRSIAQKFRCYDNNQKFEVQTNAILGCLRRRDPVKLVDAQRLLPTWGPFPLTTFAPTLERGNSSDAFLIQTPADAYAAGSVAPVPWISSVVQDEGLYPLLIAYGMLLIRKLKDGFPTLAPRILEYSDMDYYQQKQLTKSIISFYFGKKPLRDLTTVELSQPIGDRLFVNEFHRAVELHSRIAPTYSNVFRFKGKYNVADFMGINADDWGVGHAEDVFYLFNSSMLYNGFRADDPERQISHLMVNLITNFAKLGSPMYTLGGSPQVIWNAVDGAKIEFLQVDKWVKMIPDPFAERVQFWKSFGL